MIPEDCLRSSGHAVRLRGIFRAASAALAFTRRRAELHGNVLTAWRTVNPPMTPDGEVEPGVATMGSIWAFRSRLRPVLYAGLSQVRAEPPCTMRRPLVAARKKAKPQRMDEAQRSQTRTHGGVGPVAGSSSQSRGPNWASVIFFVVRSEDFGGGAVSP